MVRKLPKISEIFKGDHNAVAAVAAAVKETEVKTNKHPFREA